MKLRGIKNLITLHEISDVNNEILQLNITETEKEIDGRNWLRTLPLSELMNGEKKKERETMERDGP